LRQQRLFSEPDRARREGFVPSQVVQAQFSGSIGSPSESAHPLNKLLKELLVNFGGYNESFRGDTGLTGVDRARFDRSAQGRFEICTRHHYKCIAAA
jgi:hypothetical protein